MKNTERILLGNDTRALTHVTSLENRLRYLLSKMNVIAEDTVGKGMIASQTDFIAEPLTYLSELYWEQASQYHMSNSSRVDVFLATGKTTSAQINSMGSESRDIMRQLGKNKPTLSKKGIVSNIKREDFNVYVDESKVETYRNTIKLLNISKKLGLSDTFSQKYDVERFSNRALMVVNGELVINIQEFR